MSSPTPSMSLPPPLAPLSSAPPPPRDPCADGDTSKIGLNNNGAPLSCALLEYFCTGHEPVSSSVRLACPATCRVANCSNALADEQLTCPGGHCPNNCNGRGWFDSGAVYCCEEPGEDFYCSAHPGDYCYRCTTRNRLPPTMPPPPHSATDTRSPSSPIAPPATPSTVPPTVPPTSLPIAPATSMPPRTGDGHGLHASSFSPMVLVLVVVAMMIAGVFFGTRVALMYRRRAQSMDANNDTAAVDTELTAVKSEAFELNDAALAAQREEANEEGLRSARYY